MSDYKEFKITTSRLALLFRLFPSDGTDLTRTQHKNQYSFYYVQGSYDLLLEANININSNDVTLKIYTKLIDALPEEIKLEIRKCLSDIGIKE